MREVHRRPHRLAVVNSHPIQYFTPLYQRLAREPDIDLTVYFCSRAGLEEYADEGFGGETFAWDVPLLEGYESVFLPNLRAEAAPGSFWSLVNPGIVHELREYRYDAVWIHGHAYATYLLAVAGALAAGSALLMRCDTHLGLDRSSLRQGLRRLLMPWFYRLFDGFLAIGTRNADFYRHLGVPERRIFRVPYVVENERFAAGADLTDEETRRCRAELGLPPPDIPVVLFAGKLARGKRVRDLLSAFGRVQRHEGRRAALAIVGEGPQKEGLERLARERDLADVHFLGFRNQAELPSIYGACDVFVLPSENEAWGLVVNEAMSSGLPVVVSDDVGAAPDLVYHGENGFRYPGGDAGALAHYLNWLVRDGDLRRAMGARSREIIDRWGPEACVSGIREALEAAGRVTGGGGDGKPGARSSARRTHG